MATPSHVLFYGDSLVLAAIRSGVEELEGVEALHLEPGAGLDDLIRRCDLQPPDAIVLSADDRDTALALLARVPEALIILIAPDQTLLTLAGRRAPARTAQDLQQALEQAAGRRGRDTKREADL